MVRNLCNQIYTYTVVLSLDSREVRLDASYQILHHNTITVFSSCLKFIQGVNMSYVIVLLYEKIIIINV
jgi:hypothetical protein